MTTNLLDQIRAFNRTYAQRMGLLSNRFLGTDLNVTELRILYELDEFGPTSARELTRRLELDEGYVSRIVEKFTARNWVQKTPNPKDARQRMLSLTRAGREAFAPMADASRNDIAERLKGTHLEQIAAHASAIEQLLDAPASKVELRDLLPGDAGWLIQQHGEHYAQSDGFDTSFEALVAEILADFLCNKVDGVDRAWIAARGGQRLGSIFCVKSGEPGVAKLRLFYLVPQSRGTGLGQRLLDACIAHARDTGHRKLVLWTHESHRAAGAIYAKNGFKLIASEPVHSFGVDMVQQSWELNLID